MAIISTFDPKFQKQMLKKCIDEFGEENVVHIRKSKLFLWFYVILPFSLWFITLAWLISLLIIFVNIVRIDVAWSLILTWIRIKPLAKIVKYCLDYYYDFSIVTPQSFIRYDQTWFFKRTSKVLDLVHIRTVSVRKAWFINSLFNNWNIIILSEWTDWSVSDPKDDAGKVIFRYIYNPEYYSDRIEQLLRKAGKK